MRGLCDDWIVELFLERREEAISELDEKYGRQCRKIAVGILNDRQDAEECVNEAYLAVWRTVPPQRPEHFFAFVCKIVRNLSLKRYEQSSAEKRNSRYAVAMEELEETLASPERVDEEIEARELLQTLESYLGTLSKENRVIFLRRYWFFDSYADIARRTGLTEKNISVRLTRLRRELYKYLQKRRVLP